MRLSKFLRKNSRTLLMVFMSLLLVAFLVPDTIQGCGGAPDLRTAPLGTAFGRKMTTADTRALERDIVVLTRLAFLPGEVPSSYKLAFYLLLEEAERQGIVVGLDEVRANLRERGFTDAHLNRVMEQVGMNDEQVLRVAARWMAVDRLARSQSAGALISLPREMRRFRDREQRASVKISVIQDEAFLPLVAEPTEEELQAFFDACKDRTTAHTDEAYVFGYRYGDRVAIEYLTIDPKKIEEEITIQAVGVKQYYEENKARYPGPELDPATNKPIPLPFEEVIEQVRKDYRPVRAVEVAQSTINELYVQAHRGWTLNVETGFSDPPERIMALAEVKEAAALPFEVEHHTTGVLDENAITSLPGINGSSYLTGRSRVPFGQFVFRVKGIVEPPQPGTDTSVPVFNVGEPAPPVFGYRPDPVTRLFTPYQPYLFRVTEALPSAPPDSLDEVREQLIEDWKLVQAHELAQAHAEALAVRAREVGLSQAVDESAELKEILIAAQNLRTADGSPPARYLERLRPFEPQREVRRGTSFFGSPVGVSFSLAREVFALAKTPVDAERPFRATALSQALGRQWLIVELVQVNPVYEDLFERELQLTVARAPEQSAVAETWFDQDNIAARAKFVPAAFRESAQE